MKLQVLNEIECPYCGQERETVQCADCGRESDVIECGDYEQPQPISGSASPFGGYGDPVCDACESKRLAQEAHDE